MYLMNLYPLFRVLASVTLLVLVSCGDDSGDRDFSIALPTDEITLVSTIDFEPIQRESGFYTVQSQGTFEIPALIEITRGNTGTGFASLVIGQRKYCYQGQAIDEREINDQGYFFLYQKENILTGCSGLDRGIAIFEPRVNVVSGDQIRLTIESGGCILEENTCIPTEAKVVLRRVD